MAVWRWSRRAFLRASAVSAGAVALPMAPARAASPALSRASRVFLDRGLFIGAVLTGDRVPAASEWRESGCNTADFAVAYDASVHARQWALANYPTEGLRAPKSGERILTTAQPADTLFTICFRDPERYDPRIVRRLANWFALAHVQHPDVLVHNNQFAAGWTEAELRSYVRTAKPDLLTFTTHHFRSPDIYDALATYRKIALEGHDGTGNSPIAFGHYAAACTADINAYVPSESELNLDCFAAWTMGARWTNLFRWEQFPLYRKDGTHPPQFGQLARIARQGRRLSPFLVRLSSTDVRIVAGKHFGGAGIPTHNARPRRVPAWDSFASPYIDGISAADAAGVPGDILVGYFRPLPGLDRITGLPPVAAQQFTGKYVKAFMLLNGGSAPNTAGGIDSTDGSAADSAQQITVSLRRLGRDNRLLQVNRDTGRLNRVRLHRTGSTDTFTVPIDGGAADLFFLTTGPTYDQPPVITATTDRPAIEAGDPFTVDSTAKNVTAGQPMPDVRARLLAPPGWSTEPDGSIRLGDLASGKTAPTSWRVTAPTNADAGNFPLTVEVTYRYGPLSEVRGGARTHVTVPIPYTVLSDDFRNIGSADDAAPATGNIDGDGNSYSAQALAAAGLTPGGPVSAAGVTFTWPQLRPDNVVAAGQAFLLGRSGAILGFLGCCTHGAGGGPGRIIYTDGTQRPYQLSYPDWYGTPPPGTHPAAQLPYRNSAGGRDNNRVNVYAATVDIDPTKTVDTVILPNISADVTSGIVAMHIFAVGVA